MHRNPRSRRGRALLATGRIVAVHHLVLHAEFLLADRDRRPGGLNDPRVGRAADVVRGGTARAVVRWAARPGPARALDTAGLLAGAALVAGRGGALAPGALALTRALSAPSTGHGSDGSDPVGLVTATVLTIARSARDPRTVDACLWFLALYAAHGYLVSGLAKGAARPWRDGSALRAVFATRSYGSPTWYRVASEHPALARIATVAVVLGESAFPLALLLRTRAAVTAAGATVTLFHLGVARTMGLNRFVPAFLALQPAVRYVTGPRNPAPGEEPRDDLLPRVVAALAPLALGALAVASARDRRLVSRLRPGEARLPLPGGGRLRVRRAGPSALSGPVVVLVHGIGSTLEHFDVLVDALRDTHELLAYDRAGYGASSAAGTGRADLVAAELDRLRAVVGALGDRELVLVGHSTGAHLVWALAPELGDRLHGTVLVEGLHPHELAAAGLTGPRSGRATDRAATVRTFWARHGLAPLLDTPPWLREVPPDLRARVGAQQRRPALWAAAHAEWVAFTAGPGPESGHPHGPVVVVSAERSGRLLRPGDDPLGPASGVRGARHEVLPGCGPTDVLWRAAPVARLAGIVATLGGTS
jgi:pimeloyl-ACP methyl ester carboxylesterase